AFAVYAWVDLSQVSWFGLSPSEIRSSDNAVRGFCGACGSPLFLKYDDGAEIGLHLGTFDEAQTFLPTHHAGSEGRLPWVDIAQSLPSVSCQRRSGLAKASLGTPGAESGSARGVRRQRP